MGDNNYNLLGHNNNHDSNFKPDNNDDGGDDYDNRNFHTQTKLVCVMSSTGICQKWLLKPQYEVYSRREWQTMNLKLVRLVSRWFQLSSLVCFLARLAKYKSRNAALEEYRKWL